MDAHANLAVSTVAVPPSPALSGTVLTVATSQGGRFPAPPFNATVTQAGTGPDPSNSEIIRVVGVTGDVLTFTRQAEAGGMARAIAVGDRVAATVTAKTFADIESAVTANTSSVMAETTRATTAEAALTSAVAAEATARGAAVTAEATARVSGDATNAAAITAETTRATTAEASNRTAVNVLLAAFYH